MIFNMNGGGTALNFRVVGGTSAPSDPKENTIWVNTDTAVSSWDFSATQPIRRSNNKNLIVYPYSSGSTTANGITWTVNSDGTIKANGTATAKTNLNLTHKTDIGFILSLPAGTYRLSGCPTGGSTSTYYIEAAVSYDNWNSTSAYPKDTGSGTTITLSAPAKVAVYISIISGARVSGIVFRPQLEAGSSATSFVKGDATGQVWIQTGTTSPAAFNALKKNGTQVYPLSAKQYINVAWVKKEAKSYQSGEWNDWAYWIIGNGADGLGITGGFNSNYESQWSFDSDGKLTLYKDHQNEYSSDRVPSKRTIDITNYQTMTLKIDSFSGSASYIGVNPPSNLGKDCTCRVQIVAVGTYTVDVSGITGSVHLQTDLNYNGVTMVVSELYFS